MEHFHHLADDGNGKNRTTTCPVPNGVQDLSVVGTGHRALYIISGGCAAITLLTSLTLIFIHLTRYRAPKEQRQIVRIAFMPFLFALISWVEVADYSIAAYIDAICNLYESWAICALFLLYVQFVAPNASFGEEMFQSMLNNVTDGKPGGRNWPRWTWIMVFQYPITMLISTVILEVTEAEGTYCLSSLKPQFGHLWSQIVRMVGVLLAVSAIIRFYKRGKSVVKPHHGLSKMICFKAFVFLHLIQSVSTPP
jgi:hypothetical protein